MAPGAFWVCWVRGFRLFRIGGFEGLKLLWVWGLGLGLLVLALGLVGLRIFRIAGLGCRA